jgi:diguanylate cyclase (GGDEF)-like protein
MDPNTVIPLLALNLIGIGGLLHLIGARMPDPAGLRGFATGLMSFGLAYLLRLVFGVREGGLLGVLPDTGMVFATLSFATGLRQFSGAPPLGRGLVFGLVGAFAAIALAAAVQWQAVGRHAVLNFALGGAYLVLAGLAVAAARREQRTLRLPLGLLALMVGVLGLVTGSRGIVALTLGVGPLFAGPAAQAYYAYATVVTVLLGPNLLWMVFVRLNDRLAELATHDALTRLLNRNGLDELLQRHFAARPPRPLVLLQVDVDHFKRINDEHGHAAGDRVLREIAATLGGVVRGGDFVARLGGEEFLVGCEGADPAAVGLLAERLRRAVAERGYALPEGGELHCTVSVGVSRPFDRRAAWDAALREADQAMYAAKAAGRNRVVLAPAGAPA